MGDGPAIGGLPLGALHVGMQPLMVAGGLGEGVDPLLGDGQPVGDQKFLAHQIVNGAERFHVGLILLYDRPP